MGGSTMNSQGFQAPLEFAEYLDTLSTPAHRAQAMLDFGITAKFCDFDQRYSAVCAGIILPWTGATELTAKGRALVELTAIAAYETV